ncbi:DUF262 domain-containing protein [Desulfolutivibrio sulfoxidireducens]|nr:DUF262 domain-containing protein [Desulfolutivibrio sulfoxidireducens]
MSVSELISIYVDGELDLHPEFQRFFRWTDEQKSRFIESLLLGIPVPPVFVAEREDSKWDVIDGLQRLSTLLQFVGVLKGEKGKEITPLALTRAKYLTQLEKKVWDSKDASFILPENAKIKLKRSRIDVNIIKNTSDDMTLPPRVYQG